MQFWYVHQWLYKESSYMVSYKYLHHEFRTLLGLTRYPWNATKSAIHVNKTLYLQARHYDLRVLQDNKTY